MSKRRLIVDNPRARLLLSCIIFAFGWFLWNFPQVPIEYPRGADTMDSSRRWTQEKCGRGIEVECVQIKGTDHDNVLTLEKGLMQSIFSTAKENEGSG